MGYDTGLANRIRAKGVRVVEVDGWTTRGSSTYAPLLALWHHTAGGASGSAPSLAVCIYGRPGVPGPLCQVLQSRDPNGNDIAYVIAAGKANHGGVGAWRGISGNSKAFGLEVEHVGTTTQSGKRHEISARILAAGLEGPGGSRDPRNCCRHAEYANPPGRKIDFNVAAPPWTAADMRSRVGYWIGRTTTTTTSVQEDDMDVSEFVNALNDGQPAAERVQKQADQGAGQAIARQASEDGSALRTALRDISGQEAVKALDNVIKVHAADPNSPLRNAIQAEVAEALTPVTAAIDALREAVEDLGS